MGGHFIRTVPGVSFIAVNFANTPFVLSLTNTPFVLTDICR